MLKTPSFTFIPVWKRTSPPMLMKHFVSSIIPSLGFSSSSRHVLKTGDVLKQARIFSNSDVLEYSKMSHDLNPLHFDLKCAQSSGFEDRLVHGMLVASLFPRIIASHFVSSFLSFLNFSLSTCFLDVEKAISSGRSGIYLYVKENVTSSMEYFCHLFLVGVRTLLVDPTSFNTIFYSLRLSVNRNPQVELE